VYKRQALDRVTDTEVTVVAEDAFTAEWIAQKYRDPLVAYLSAVAGRPLGLTVRAGGRGTSATREQRDLFDRTAKKGT
jgi:chromosomal replication initiation ATPase DnaA